MAEPTTSEETTALPACAEAADCTDDEPACRAAACIGGACVFDDLPDGTTLPDPIVGDCTAMVCEGGRPTAVADEGDVEDDGVVCTLDICDGTTPVHLPDMTACYTGDPATAGVGACSPGVQMCDERGVPVGPCVGEVVPGAEDCEGALVDEDCDGAINEDGPTCVCVPNEPVTCYTGPDGTLDVGVCLAGEAVCEPDGLGVGACAGEVVPGEEDCDPDGLDEDCDGEVDESGLSCVCGDGVVSNDEVCDDGNMAPNDACASDCSQGLGLVEVSVGVHHACVRLTGDLIKCWGNNSSGELGLGDTVRRGDDPGEMGPALPYVDLGVGLKVVQLAAGGASTCARFDDGRVKCWGDNNQASLGQGDNKDRGDEPGEMGDNLPFVDLGVGKHAVDVQTDTATYCAHLDDGRVKCWGWGGNGILGTGNIQPLGDTPDETGDGLPFVNPGGGGTVLDLWTGSYTICARVLGGAIKCWGANSYGMLGLGDINHRGDMPGEMGNALPAVNLGAGELTSIRPGLFQTCAVFVGGALRCWGHGLGTGQGNIDDHIGDMPGEMGANLPLVDVAGDVVEVVGGNTFNCVRLVGGEVKCFGRGFFGVLGSGSTADVGDVPGEMGANLPTVDLGSGRTAVRLFARAAKTCALLDDNTLKCWGNNHLGHMGYGDDEDRGDEPGEMGDNLPAIQLF